jgi:outer membrane protein TolC
MRKNKLLFGPAIAAAVLLFGLPASKAEGQTLDHFLRAAEAESPALKALQSEYLAARKKAPQVSGLPDPQLSAGIFLRPMERYMGDQTVGLQVMQMFPWFGTLGAAGREAAAMAQARFEAWREARSGLLFDVKAEWHAVYVLDREISIAREALSLLRSLETIALTRFSVGGSGPMPDGLREPEKAGKAMSGTGSAGRMGSMAGMPGGGAAAGTGAASPAMKGSMSMPAGSGTGLADLLRIRMEILELENRLELLDDDRAVAAARLNGTVGRDPRDPIALPETLQRAELPASSEEAFELIGRANPMLKMLESEGRALRAKESMDRKMGLPMFGLGLQYEAFRPRPDQEAHGGTKGMLMPMVSVSIPLWRKKYAAAVDETRLLRQGLEDRERDARNRLSVGWEEALARLRDAERRTVLYDELAGLARQALDLLTAGYAAAGRDFDELIGMHRQLLDLRLKLAVAGADRNIAVALVERLIGE